MPIPRYRPHDGAALFSVGFRPFFLCAASWSALAIPLWLMTFAGAAAVPTALAPAATVAGFRLTAIPNWTGRMLLQGGPLVLLVALWLIGRRRSAAANISCCCRLRAPPG